MQIKRRSRNSVRIGYALVIVLVFLAVTLLTYAGLMAWTATNAKITKRNNLFNQSEAAAESATENVLATMMRDFNNLALNPASTYTALVPGQTNWPIQFLFTDSTGITNQTSITMDPTSWTPLPYPYTGLYGLGQNCTVSSTATPLNQGDSLSASVSQSIWFGVIPVFQYAIFYNPDLEINPGATMSVSGKVHSNANIWATGNGASTPLTFGDTVEAVSKVTLTRGPNDPQTRSGNVIFLDTTNNPLAGAKSLTLPIGTNNNPIAAEGLLNLPPAGLGAPNASAYSVQGQVYPYNEADLIISNAASGTAGTGTTSISIYYQDRFNVSIMTQLQPDVTNIVIVGPNKTTNTYFSFVTNVSFYDYREYATVQAVQIDVAKLNKWLTNTTSTGGSQYNIKNGGPNGNTGDKGHWINGVYVYNSVPSINGSPSTTGQLPAVRVINGQRLPPGGLTIATPQPLYVVGNYNTTTNGANYSLTLGSSIINTAPAALMGDAITILSTNWNDGNNIKGKALGTRKSADTTINAAALEGIVPSQLDAGGNKHYSGGVENFLRLLEDWSNNSSGHSGAGVLTYNGSIVVLFNSVYAINYWQQTGNYYNAPDRQWGFDLSFTNQNKLPPMTPQVRAVVRQSWHWTAN